MAECIHNKRPNDGKEKYPSKASIVISDEEWYECDEPGDLPRSKSPSIHFDGEGVIIKGKGGLKKVPSPSRVNVCFKESIAEIPRYTYEAEFEQDELLTIDENHLSTSTTVTARQSPSHCHIYRAGTPAFRKGSPLPASDHEEDISSCEVLTWKSHGTMQRAGTPVDKDGQFLDNLSNLNNMLKP